MQNWQSFWSVVTRTNDANKVTGIFVILCSIFVVIATLFTSLHVRYVYLGVTTNELDKWSEIEHLVDIGVLYKVSPPIEEETFVEKGFLTGEPVYISLKDERILNVDEVSLVPVESVVSDINNIYDKGFWENLRERLQI
ncbi:SWF1 [Candida oxycetoniae]|uniref:SWF1 n=1 Tax=Candida oxycetoniae TaxID=497107 RepID=A0AAI9WXF0_9ASCO|nr:SWF1 [Candida oxycetoniae]KAI3404003.2 SWF1 [Candida oxycetoniae]